jgi:hypothetical protein
MRFLVTCTLLFVFTASFGQEFSKDMWHDGFVVTANGDTLSGKINYDIEANMVQFTNAQTIKAYSSYKVFYFEIFDAIYHNYRQFYTIPYKLRGNYETPVIFELLYEGGLSLLAREKLTQETISSTNPMWAGNTRIIQNAIRYDFYFLDKKGNITYFNGRKSELWRIMGNKKDKVREFIRLNGLQTNEVKDLIRIASFYNSI